MKRHSFAWAAVGLAIAMLLAAPSALAAAETWKDAPISCIHCSMKVKGDPDAHTRDCMMTCAGGGFGLFTSDGKFLKFDKAGNDKALAALKASEKKDHLHATVTGERDGETIKVESFSLS
jgi:hypothetical protein